MIFRLIQSAVAVAQGRSSKWPAVRKAFLAGKRCAACGTGKAIEAHHCLPRHLYPELELRQEFLIALCRACHYLHGHCGASWSCFNPHVVEDAALMLKRRENRCYRRLEVLK